MSRFHLFGRGGLLAAVAAMALGTQSCLPASPEGSGDDARAIAQLVDRHYNRPHSLRANFSQTFEGLGMKKTEGGTLLLVKPARMRWDYTEPSKKLFLIDGKYAWFYVPGTGQAQRIPANQLDDLRSPLRFLLGHTELEKELTDLHLVADSTGPDQAMLVGRPKGQENRVRSVSLLIRRSTGGIESIEIDETDGAVTRFTFSDEQPDAVVPEGAFRFSPPPGVSVVDSLPPV
jgi:outer membrane lipoprotein carrier protein